MKVSLTKVGRFLVNTQISAAAIIRKRRLLIIFGKVGALIRVAVLNKSFKVFLIFTYDILLYFTLFCTISKSISVSTGVKIDKQI